MKYIKKFNEDRGKSIEDWCKEFELLTYTINDVDGTVDSNYYVDISNQGLEKIPIQFGVIGGSFDCKNNYLTSLEGYPRKVYGGLCVKTTI